MLANNIIRQFFTQLIGLISGFITSVITARILGPQGRGDYTLLLNASGFLCLLLGLSFGTSIVHVISTQKMPLRNTVNSFVLIVLLLMLICWLFLALFPFSRFPFLLPADQSQKSLFYNSILMCLFTISLISTLFNAVLSGKKLFLQQQKVNSFSSALSIVLYGLLFYYNVRYGLGFNLFIIAYTCIACFPALGSYFMYLKHADEPFNWSFLNISQLKYVLGFSFLAYMCNVFQFLCFRMDFWFVEYFKGSKDLGFYSLSVNLAQMLWLLPQAVSIILLSYSGAEDRQKGIDNTNVLCRIAIAMVLTAAIFLLATVGYFIPLLYGIEFIKAADLLKVLLAGIVPFSITTILASYFAGIGKMRINLYCSMIGFAVSLGLDVVLIPLYGNMGAAIATVISYFLSTSFIVWMYLKITGSGLSDLIIIKKEDLAIIMNKIGGAGLKKKTGSA